MTTRIKIKNLSSAEDRTVRVETRLSTGGHVSSPDVSDLKGGEEVEMEVHENQELSVREMPVPVPALGKVAKTADIEAKAKK